MAVGLTQLRPYASFILGQLNQPDTTIRDLLDEARQALPFDDEPHLNPLGAPLFEYREQEGLDLGLLLYEERRPPSWLLNSDDLRDLLNHLLVVAKHRKLVAIYMSDSRRRNLVLQKLGPNGNGAGLLRLIPEDRLNAAFVQGATRTLWMSAIPAPVTSRPDSKILAGRDLRDALDPLTDQAYYFSAARSNVPGLLPVGVTPRRSRAWIGASRDWSQFCQITGSILSHLAGTPKGTHSPLPVVAVPSQKKADLRDAFEAHLIPPELFVEDAESDHQDQKALERWAHRSSFRIVPAGTRKNRLEINVTLEEVPLGTASLTFDVSDPAQVRWEVELTPAKSPFAEDSPKHKHFVEDLDELRKILRRRHWLKIWFESGQTLSDGVLFEIRHRDMPFEDFTWLDFEGYDVKKEKFWSDDLPTDAIDRIGQQKSLFCWVRNHWATEPIRDRDAPPKDIWLACDDGAMEIADFIQVELPQDASKAKPVLSLIHVKGAKSKSENRKISVAGYEVVTGQAVKNLRYLDRLHLDKTLEEGIGNKIGSLVWHNGSPTERKAMIDVLKDLGSSYERRVVILQPHVTWTQHDEVRKSTDSSGKGDKARLRQLDTLLLAAEATAHGLGAELMVIGDGTMKPDDVKD